MSNCTDGLMFDGVHLLKWVVENTGGVNGLEAQHLVVEVANEKTLGGEGIWLDIDIGPGNALQERRLADIGVSADDESTGVGVDGWETTEMLSHLLEVDERIFQTLADGGHATQGGALEVFALEQTLAATG